MRKTERILSAMLALILTLTMSMGGTVSACLLYTSRCV